MTIEKIYICSALRSNVQENIRKAKEYCRWAAVECGVIPIAPHLLFPQFLDDDIEAEREIGISFGLKLLKECSALWYFGDKVTGGMVIEINEAFRLGIPVKYVSAEEMKIQKDDGGLIYG